MSWSAASLSSLMSYSSASSVGAPSSAAVAAAAAAASAAPPPAATPPAPGQPHDDRPLSPPLSITVMAATTAPAVRSSGGAQPWDPADALAASAFGGGDGCGGAAAAGTGDYPAGEVPTSAGGFPAGDNDGYNDDGGDGDGDDDDDDYDVDLERATAGGEAPGRTSPPPDRPQDGTRPGDNGGAPEDGGRSDGNPPAPGPRGAAAAATTWGDGDGDDEAEEKLSSRTLGGGFRGALVDAFGELDTEEAAPQNAPVTEAEGRGEQRAGGRGPGPTQVLVVPEVGSRDIDEFLGIQVKFVGITTWWRRTALWLGEASGGAVEPCRYRGRF